MIDVNRYYTLKNGKVVRKVTLAQVQIEFQKKPFQKPPKDIESIKKLLIEFAEQNLPPNEQRKMHARVKNVKTKKELEEAIKLAEKYAEQHDKRISDKKKQNKETFTPEPLSEKELKELCDGIMKYPALSLLIDGKMQQRVIYGNIKPPAQHKNIDQDSPGAAEALEKSHWTYLLEESDYIRKHLKRLYEEKIEGEIANWYERFPSAFTSRLRPIQGRYEYLCSVLTRRLQNMKGNFEEGYKKLFDVAKQCDIKRAGWLFLAIADFKKAVEGFHKVVSEIYEESFIELNKIAVQTEYTAPLQTGQWAAIFGKSENTIRKWRDAKGPKKKYHFDQVSNRLWRLPKNEAPPEYYLDKFSEMIK